MAKRKNLTASEIASDLGVDLHRVKYIFTSRGIKPTDVIGSVYVYDESAIKRVRDALDETAATTPTRSIARHRAAYSTR